MTAQPFCKIGQFSDGGGRIRVVKQGYAADPAPTDTTKIIYDSDWPDVLCTQSGFYGSHTGSVSNTSITSDTVNFPSTLAYTPGGVVAFDANYWNVYPNNEYTLYQTIKNAYWQDTSWIAGPRTYNVTPSPSKIVFDRPQGTYTSLWTILCNDTSSATPVTARAGSGSWMELSAVGPVVAKPGKNISSNNPDDYLLPPPSMGRVIFQPIQMGSVNQLPFLAVGYDNNSNELDAYCATIPHGLGYVPLFFSGGYLGTPNDVVPYIAVDTQNVYIFATWNGARQSTLTTATLSYFLLPVRWI